MTVFIIYSLGVLYAGAYWNRPIMGFHQKIAKSVRAFVSTFGDS